LILWYQCAKLPLVIAALLLAQYSAAPFHAAGQHFRNPSVGPAAQVLVLGVSTRVLEKRAEFMECGPRAAVVDLRQRDFTGNGTAELSNIPPAELG
jgi:hypothetical protein